MLHFYAYYNSLFFGQHFTTNDDHFHFTTFQDTLNKGARLMGLSCSGSQSEKRHKMLDTP
jgi:hypothetical protein